jgi:hypothetical protein
MIKCCIGWRQTLSRIASSTGVADEAVVEDIRVIIDRYVDVLVGMVAKMRLLSSWVLKGRIDLVFYVVVVSI